MPAENPRNLIVLHLESISHSRLWEYRAELETVWSLIKQGRYFSRFYTSSTSSTMSYLDFVCGSNAAGDANLAYGSGGRRWGGVHFFRDLQKIAPYDSATWVYGPPLQVKAELERTTFPASDKIYHTKYVEVDPDAFHNGIAAQLEKIRAEGRPFCLYFWDHTPHMASFCQLKNAATTFGDRFRLAFRLLDRSIARFLATVADAGLMEETSVVAFGDHGDELWTHHLNKGYCHAFEGYAPICWTPMFIIDPRVEAGVDVRLASNIDLYHTTLRLLDPDIALRNNGGYLFGIDLFREDRRLAFTQNLYALQAEYADNEKALGKSYAVTDGEYRLVAASDGGGGPGAGGMELYCDEIDPANMYNLLELVDMDDAGGIAAASFSAERAWQYFPGLFGPDVVEGMVDAYRGLREELMRFVAMKEEKALALLPEAERSKASLFPPSAFRKKRVRFLGSRVETIGIGQHKWVEGETNPT